ncbi:MAG: hypothetical protein AAGJ93_06690, partial [Bacteroidota bacterium]
MQPKYQDFITNELPQKLRTLAAEQPPNFGLMTAHHMVEHLIYVTKSMMKRRGEPEGELTKSQLYFRKFLDAGCPFEYRPREGAKVNDLRTASIEEAIQILEGANEKFYALFASNPEHKSYSDMMGEFNMSELELFNYQHGRCKRLN